MIEEYMEIRKARLALMCAGDPIYYINFYYHVEEWSIVDVLSATIVVDTGAYRHPVHYLATVEMYEGKLYILFNGLFNLPLKEKLKKVASIVKLNECVNG